MFPDRTHAFNLCSLFFLDMSCVSLEHHCRHLQSEQEHKQDYTHLNLRCEKACKTLLLSLATEDLRTRLHRSRFDPASARRKERLRKVEVGTMLDDDWLEEAANAFAVPFRHRRQNQVVDGVMDAVRKAREVAPGTAASVDADRRLALHKRTWDSSAALREAKAMGVMVSQKDIQKRHAGHFKNP